MEQKLSIDNNLTPNLSLPLNVEEQEEVVPEKDPLSSNFPLWSSRSKCLQAYVCFIMSFSSIVRFALAVGQHGMAIFIPYLLFRTFVGASSVLIELTLGRYIMGNVAGIWKMCPFGKGVLYASLGTCVFALICNNISAAYILKYLFSLFHEEIPWEKCRKPWAQINCFERGKNFTALLSCLKSHSEEFCNNLTWESSGTQFWNNEAGNVQNVKSICLTFLFMGIFIILVGITTVKGIRSCEKVFVFLVHVPLTLAFIQAIATFLIPGAGIGLKKIWVLDLSLLLNIKVWVIGFQDTLEALGLGILALPFISSHGNFLDDILIDLLVVAFSDLFCCFFLAAPILSVIANIKYSFHHRKTFKPLFKNKTEVFTLMSEALLFYPYPNVLWTFIFYFELVLILLGTQAIISLTICETIMGLTRKFLNFFYVSCIFGVASFVVSVPFVFIKHNFAYPLDTFIVTLVCLSEMTLVLFYGLHNLNDDFHFMMGYPPPLFFRWTWFTSGLVGLTFIILKMWYKMPNYPFEYMVYVYVSLPVTIYIIVAIWETVKAYKSGKISQAFMASPDWGPDNSLLQNSRIIFNSKAVTKEFMYRQELYKKTFVKPPDFTDQNIVQMT